MSVLMVRAKVKPATVPDLESAVKKMFAALDEAQPTGIRYASCRLSDGATFVVLLEVEDGADNPLPALPAFRDFQEGLKKWVAEPPIAEQLTVIGSYKLFLN
jgi:hypothetical protein